MRYLRRIFLVTAATCAILSARVGSAQPWSDMDYGPFLTTTMEVERDNIAYKAIGIRLDAGAGGVSKGHAFVAFDTDTLRLAAGWTGAGFIDWKSVVYDGSHNTHPSIVGRRLFANPVGPGWANPTDQTFDDHRLRGTDGRPYGPLDRSWGRWNGIYKCGPQTILSYSIGTTPVLESPALEGRDPEPLLTRTLQLGPRDRDLLLQVAWDPQRAARLRRLADRSGNTHEIALLVPTPTAGGASTAAAGRSYRFEGDSHLEVAESDDFDLSGSDYTVAARLRTTEGGTIFSQAARTGPWVPDAKTFFVRDGRLCFDIGWVGAVQSRQRVNDGRWHDVAMTFQSATGTVQLYVDGTLQGQGNLRPKSPVTDHVVRIGYTSANFPESQGGFVGELERIRFAQRLVGADQLAGEQLSEGEGLIGDWRPAQVEASTVRDASGHGHTAKLIRGSSSAGRSFGTAIAVVGFPGVTWETGAEGCVRLRVPRGETSVRFKLLYAPLDQALDPRWLVEYLAVSPPAGDLETGTRGGPQAWPEVLETTIQPMGDPNGPFQAEVLTLPEENPWRSWIRLGGFDFFADGDRAVLGSWQGDVWLVSGLRGTAGKLRWQRIASGLFQPLGLKIVNERVYVLGRDQITRLHDLNGDGETDYYENFNNDAQVTDHFHEFAMDLQTDLQSNFYYMKGARHALPPIVPQHGTIMYVSRDGRESKILAGGFRAPDGLLVNNDGTFFSSDQEGHWTPMNRINLIRSGGFYGNMMAANPEGRAEDETDPPVCWIHREVDRSPTAQVRVDSDQWGSLQGSLLSLSYGTGKTWRVLMQRAGDLVQGGIVQLPIPEFPTGIQRGRFHPLDGKLYLCGLFGWSSDKTLPGGFYRVGYTGRPVLVPDALAATSAGVLIHFPTPLEPEVAAAPTSYSVSRWNYKRTANYGSPDFRVSDGKPGRDAVSLTGVSVSQDRQSVFLHIADMCACMQMRIRFQLLAADGASVSNFIDHTVHVLPELTSDMRSPFADRLEAPAPASRGPQDVVVARPGLVFRTRAPDTGDGEADVRLARLVALRAEAGERLTVLGATGPFLAEWEGFIKSELAQQVSFSATGLGNLDVSINGNEVLRMDTTVESRAASAPVVLRAGWNSLAVRLSSRPDGSGAVRLFWSRSGEVVEPIRPDVLFHDPASSGALDSSLAIRAGRELVATYHCRRCHALPDSAVDNDGMPELQSDSPSLFGAGDRFDRAWLQRWLTEPTSLRNRITAPVVLPGLDEQGVADLVAYLDSLHGAPGIEPAGGGLPDTDAIDQLVDAGLVLYEDLGCIACHHFERPDAQDDYERMSLRFVGAKYASGALVAFLRRPHEYYAWRPMPDFQLTEEEARSLAAYLRRRSEILSDKPSPVGDVSRGKAAFDQSGCLTCHAVDATTPRPAPKDRPLFALRDVAAGCLATDASARGAAPQFAFEPGQRSAIMAFLQTDGRSLEVNVPAEAAQRYIDRLQCTNCHRRDGGVPTLPEILGEEGEQGHPPEFLPPLTWTGEKLHTDWLFTMLQGSLGYRLRPWKKGRMPAFPAHARVLADGLAAQHGVPATREPSGPRDPAVVSLGERLTQKEKGFNCLQCHGLEGKPPEAPFESRGIDFHRVRDRVRWEFYRRWLGNPIQFDSAIPMPRFSPDEKTTPVAGILDGEAEKQFEAIWQYLNSLGE